MLQTLFYIPQTVAGMPFLGFGLLAGIWAVLAGLYLIIMFLRRGWDGDFQAGLLYSFVIGAVIVWGLPMISEARGIPVRGYGLMMLIAVTSSVALAIYRARQVGLADDVIYSLAMWMILPGIIGARIFFVIEYRDRFFAPGMTLGESLIKAVSLQEGGLVVFGSLIGAVLGLLAFTRLYRLPLLPLIDVTVPSMALGQALGRIGCLFNGCCFGGECDLSWQITFPSASPPYIQQAENNKLDPSGLRWISAPLHENVIVIDHVMTETAAQQAGLRSGMHVTKINRIQGEKVDSLPYTFPDGNIQELSPHSASSFLATSPTDSEIQVFVSEKLEPIAWTIPESERSLPIHPTQIYSTIDALLLCGFLLAWIPFRRRHGELLALTLILHSISRFMLEKIRVDETEVFGTPWSISQNISIGMFVIGMGLLLWINLGTQREKLWVLRV